MALVFLPANVIHDISDELSASVTSSRLIDHLDYNHINWIDNALWPLSTWSVYRQPIRMNNDCQH